MTLWNPGYAQLYGWNVSSISWTDKGYLILLEGDLDAYRSYPTQGSAAEDGLLSDESWTATVRRFVLPVYAGAVRVRPSLSASPREGPQGRPKGPA
jgi:hypothetical protein